MIFNFKTVTLYEIIKLHLVTPAHHWYLEKIYRFTPSSLITSILKFVKSIRNRRTTKNGEHQSSRWAWKLPIVCSRCSVHNETTNASASCTAYCPWNSILKFGGLCRHPIINTLLRALSIYLEECLRYWIPYGWLFV